MRNIAILGAALETVEERLRGPLSVRDVAEACYSSCSGLQKLFGYAFRCSVNEYITKRRISCASYDLLNGGGSVMDIALEYQYGSSEAFSRAFKRNWGISPNEFRKSRRFPGLLPKFTLENEYGGFVMKKRKPIFIGDLYDEIKKLGGSYVLSLDMIHMMHINDEYGSAAGDLAIAEAFARLERETCDDMLAFRIGGDEFAVVTGYKSLDDAEALARRITSRNGETFSFGDKEIPVSLRVGISRLPEGKLNYKDTLKIMYDAIGKAVEAENHIGVYIADAQ